MEPFWDLKFSEICRVSCACIQRIPYKQRVAFSDEQRRLKFFFFFFFFQGDQNTKQKKKLSENHHIVELDA